MTRWHGLWNRAIPAGLRFAPDRWLQRLFVFLLLGVGLIFLPPPAQSGAATSAPMGLFVCRGPGPTPEREVNLPFIDGWLVRPGWEAVEPAEGKYDWRLIEGDIALAKRLGKKITLTI